MYSLSGFALFFQLLIAQAPAEPKTADEVMQRVRLATQFSKDKIPNTGLQMTGKGTYAGMPAQYRLLFNRVGHFVQTTTARIATGSGYDGSHAWVKDLGGERRIQELSDANRTILSGLFATSLWLDPQSGLSYTLSEKQPKDGSYSLKFVHAPTDLSGTVLIDSKTWLPVEVSMMVEGRNVTTKLTGTVEFNGMKFPKTSDSLSGSENIEAYTLDNITAAPTFVRNPYAPVITPPSDVTFDNNLPAAVGGEASQDRASARET